MRRGNGSRGLGSGAEAPRVVVQSYSGLSSPSSPVALKATVSASVSATTPALFHRMRRALSGVRATRKAVARTELL